MKFNTVVILMCVFFISAYSTMLPLLRESQLQHMEKSL